MMYGQTVGFPGTLRGLEWAVSAPKIVIADAETQSLTISVDFLFGENGRIVVVAVRAPWKTCGICEAADVDKVPIKTEEQTSE